MSSRSKHHAVVGGEHEGSDEMRAENPGVPPTGLDSALAFASTRTWLINYITLLLECGHCSASWEEVQAVLLKYLEAKTHRNVSPTAKDSVNPKDKIEASIAGTASTAKWWYPSRTSTWCITRKSALANALNILEELCPDKVWLHEVCVLREEEKCIVPSDYLSNLDHDIESSCSLPIQDDDDSNADAGVHDAPKLLYEIVVRFLESDTALLSKIVQIYWDRRNRPIVVGQRTEGFERLMPSSVLKERIKIFNGFLRMAEVHRSSIVELETKHAPETSSATTDRKRKKRAPPKHNLEHLSRKKAKSGNKVTSDVSKHK